MSRIGMEARLGRLEQAAGAQVPLWIQRWLGDPLSDADHTRAAAEWAEVQCRPATSPTTLPAHLCDWLDERSGVETTRGEAR